MTLDQFRAACRRMKLTYGYEPHSQTWFAQKAGERHPIRYSVRDIRRMSTADLSRDFDFEEKLG